MSRRRTYGTIVLAIGMLILGAVAYQIIEESTTPGPRQAAPDSGTRAVDVGAARRDGEAGPADKTQNGSFRFAPPVSSVEEIAAVRFADAEGRQRTLEGFRGRLVLLNIWATWCAPCREEMPTLDRLQGRLGGTDFSVIALSIDQEGAPVVREFYAELGLEALAIYVDQDGRAPSMLSVLGIPTTLLIDAEGREIGRYTGPAEWDSEPVMAAIREHLD